MPKVSVRPVPTRMRCAWVGDKPHLIYYHDEEWGVPVHDDQKHFEMLLLEGAQAGLTWETILRRRDGYRKAFAQFDPAEAARFTARTKAALLKDPGIILNRLKIEAAVTNARAFLAVQKAFGSFDCYLWRFVDGKPKVNQWAALKQVPATTPERTPYRRISSSGVFASSAARSSTPTCRPSAW